MGDCRVLSIIAGAVMVVRHGAKANSKNKRKYQRAPCLTVERKQSATCPPTFDFYINRAPDKPDDLNSKQEYAKQFESEKIDK